MMDFFMLCERLLKLSVCKIPSKTKRNKNNEIISGITLVNKICTIVNIIEYPMLCIPAVATFPHSAVIIHAVEEKTLRKVEISSIYNSRTLI